MFKSLRSVGLQVRQQLRCLTTGMDPYQVLELTRPASLPRAKAAYYRMCMRYHPDRRDPELGKEQQKDKFLEVGLAFELICQELRDSREKEASSGSNGATAPRMTKEEAELFRFRSDPDARLENYLLGNSEVQKPLIEGFRKYFFKVAGENYDVMIHKALEKKQLGQAIEAFHCMKEAGETPTRATYEMLIRGCSYNMQRYQTFEECDHLTRRMWETAIWLFEEEMPKLYEHRLWTYGEMIRVAGRCGRMDYVRKLFNTMVKHPFTVPEVLQMNAILEACFTTGHHHLALVYLNEFAELRKPMWFPGRFKPNSTTFNLVLASVVEGKRPKDLAKVLTAMASNGMYVDQSTGERLLAFAIKENNPSVAAHVYGLMESRGTPVSEALEESYQELQQLPTPKKEPRNDKVMHQE
eukprot:Lithocolla_globosa_v1_NODE_4843_length_1353_cov_10.527735.p1 type:complete len:411 gc:universal NODE_4843_length_1353_cov_10.527735:38-1270(+)